MIRRMIIKSVFSCIILLALAGCHQDKKQTVPANVAPKLNPNPKYFITVKVKGDLAGATLKFTMYYDTLNPKCVYMENELEGVTASYQIGLNKSLTEPGVVKFPIDRYQPGYCDWRPTDLELDGASIVSVMVNKKPWKPFYPYLFLNCANKKCELNMRNRSNPGSTEVKFNSNSLLNIIILK